LAAHEAVAAEVRLFDRLFTEDHPDAGGRDFLQCLNPNSAKTGTAYVEPGVAQWAPESHAQFERHGYFVTDRKDHTSQAPVFNRVTGLRDTWKKPA
jgi:glutaminyl-tRNA synthetase